MIAISVETSSEHLFKVVHLHLYDCNLEGNTPEELFREIVVRGTRSIRLSVSPQIDCPEDIVSLDLLSIVEQIELFLAITGLDNIDNIGKLPFSPDEEFNQDDFDEMLEDLLKQVKRTK